MMNTIEYRVDCQLLQHLHWDNNLGCRFPIGKLDQVESWDAEKVRQFHERVLPGERHAVRGGRSTPTSRASWR